MWLFLLGIFAIACDEPEPAPVLEEQLGAFERRAHGIETTLQGGDRALEAAALWPDADSDQRERILALLRRAAVLESPRGCLVTHRLAQLEAASGSEHEAFLRGYRAQRHFDGPPECHRLLRELLATLEAPPVSVLAAIDQEAGRTLQPCTVQGVDVLGEGPRYVRVVLRFDEGRRSCPFDRSDLEEGPGGVMELRLGPGALDDLPSQRTIAAGGLAQLTRREGGVLRFHLDPGSEADVVAFGSPPRLVVDVQQPRASGGPRVIMLDPGHGGEEIGGHYEELVESTLVMDIAEVAAEELRRRLPRTRVLLTRSGDERVSLEERTARANSVEADIFVSIHLNAVEEQVRVGGVTTFVLDTNNDAAATRLAAQENGTALHAVTEMQRLIASLHQRGQREQTRRLAEALHRSTLAAGRRTLPALPDRGVRSAAFFVLVGARMPAVLLEASFMSYPAEAAALRTRAYRRVLGGGIADGIVAYVRGETPPVPE